MQQYVPYEHINMIHINIVMHVYIFIIYNVHQYSYVNAFTHNYCMQGLNSPSQIKMISCKTLYIDNSIYLQIFINIF